MSPTSRGPTPLRHARWLYGRMLKSLDRFHKCRQFVDETLEKARRQAARDARIDPDTPEFEELVEQIADRDARAVQAMHVSNRHRDDAVAFALAFLVELNYFDRTAPFTNEGDRYAELRGGD